jgi:ATP-dependent helicase/nuclease subunit A
MSEEVKAASVEWTAQQRAAITTADRSLLVSAAAGSGKTATLAERVAQLVRDPAIACPVSEILVLTFTEAAAAEMRVRIERSLDRAEASEFARRQRLLLGQASIGTIHGFCSRLLRRHFHMLGIDPTFAILDEATGVLLRQEAVRAVLDAEYVGARGDSLRGLVEWFGDGDDERIATQVLAIHGLMGSIVDPVAWRAEAVARLEGAAGDPERSALGAYFAAETVGSVRALRERLEEAREDIGGIRQYVEYAAKNFEPLIGQWEQEIASRGVWALTPPPSKLPSLPPIKGTVEGKDAAKTHMDFLKEAVLAGPTFAGIPGEAGFWRTATASSLPHARELIELAGAFERTYTEAKRARKSLDFGDLERLTLELLKDTSNGVAAELRGRFRFVLIDECQDINSVQNEIINLLSRADNLFSVGDVKQSIYQFRLAEPELFQRRRATYAGEPETSAVIDLSENFRSRAPLLAAVNAVFERLMVGGGTEIDYRDGHELRPGATYPESSLKSAPIELHLLPPPASPAARGAGAAGASAAVESAVAGSAAAGSAAAESDGAEGGEEEDLESIEREAECVAWRIRQMMGRETVFDRGTKEVRPIRFADIAVLLRVARVKTKQFASQLRRRGIPVHADSRGGLLEAQEVCDLLALLQLIDNPQRDVELATYLRSPLSLLAEPDEAMARARVAGGPDVPFHAAVAAFAEGMKDTDPVAAALARALGRVESWRTMALRRPCAEVLQEICDRTLYPAYVAGLADGPQRQANIEELLGVSRAYCAEEGRDVAGFTAFVRAMEREEAGPDSPSVPAEDGDVVRVMTVHKSKGLEFPVVFLVDLGKKFNERDLGGNVLIGKECFLAPKAVDVEKALLYPSPAWMIAREQRRPKLTAEELRVLYVAMTRAREQLILVATVNESQRKTLAGWGERGPRGPSEREVLGMKTAVGWLHAAGLTALAAGSQPIAFIEHTEQEALAWAAESRSQESGDIPREILELRPFGAPTAGGAARVARSAWVYPHDGAAARAATASVTSLTHTQAAVPAPAGDEERRGGQHGDSSSLAAALPLPRIAQQTLELAATDRGTATHLALELLDYGGDLSPEGIHAQLTALVERETLTPRELAVIDVGALRWLLASELGPLLRGEAGAVHREPPIYLPEGDGEGLDRQMVRGRIDVMVDTAEGPVVIDYKTDRVWGERLEERVGIYAGQVAFYRRAAEALTGRGCAGVYLAFIDERARVIRKL